jgi:hypothetical protein
VLKQICFRHCRVQIYCCEFRQNRTVDVESTQFIYATKKSVFHCSTALREDVLYQILPKPSSTVINLFKPCNDEGLSLRRVLRNSYMNFHKNSTNRLVADIWLRTEGGTCSPLLTSQRTRKMSAKIELMLARSVPWKFYELTLTFKLAVWMMSELFELTGR